MPFGYRISLAAVIVLGIVFGVFLIANPDFNLHRPSLDSSALVKLPRASKSTADLSHLSGNVLAPTDSWISGAVLQKQPQPIYPQPLALQPNASGLMFSAPTVTSLMSDTIAAPFAPDAGFSIDGAQGYQLTRYDGVSADLTYADYGTATFAEGSPFIWYKATRSQALHLLGRLSLAHTSGKFTGTTTGSVKIAAATTGSHNFNAATLRLDSGDTVVFAAIPKGMSDSLISAAARHPISSVTTEHQTSGANEQTTLTYHVADGGSTVLGALPYRTAQLSGADEGSLYGLYGPMRLKQANTIHLLSPKIDPSDTLPIAELSSIQKDQLARTLKSDIPAIKLDAATSYEAGKQLYSAANLLQIAHQLGDRTAADQIYSKLAPALEHWLHDGFYYDPQIHGIAPKVDNFGSSDFNDHHFHYGYFIYAADIVARYDSTFLKQYRPYVDLLAADIASPEVSANFPAYRMFDPYAGHAWAAGLAPFSDGNDEESSSEAINAWNAVALWADITHDQPLADTGSWLLANEVQTAARIWLRKPANAGYTAPLVDIVWGGKRVYQTWFSNDPVDKLAIQLIPMNPLEQTTLAENQRIKQIVSASIADNNYNQPLGDYALMYLALVDHAKAASLESKQASIDSANSHTYLQAWIMTARSS